MALMGYSGTWEKLIHEKSLSRKSRDSFRLKGAQKKKNRVAMTFVARCPGLLCVPVERQLFTVLIKNYFQ